MLNNKWMVVCLLVGSILAAAMVSSIPIYTKGILQRLLTRDLENMQVLNGRFPGRYLVELDTRGVEGRDRAKFFDFYNAKITGQLAPDIGLPVNTSSIEVNADMLLKREAPDGSKNIMKQYLVLAARSDLESHIEIIAGRIFSQKIVGGIIEAVITEDAMSKQNLIIGKTYDFSSGVDEEDGFKLKVKITGVFKAKGNADAYWHEGLVPYEKSMLVDYRTYLDEILRKDTGALDLVRYFYAFDYHKISLDNVKYLVSIYYAQKKWLQNGNLRQFVLESIPVLEQYRDREDMLKATLWILIVPVILMLAFYIFMVSQLIIEYEKNEIALLKSRGASRLQVFMGYLTEGLFLGGVTLLAGPPLGLLFCKVMGASNGFMEFVQRKALKLSLDIDSFLYALLAIVFFILTMLIPAFLSSRVTIVQHKQSMAGRDASRVWKKFCLDGVLLAMAGYGYYRYTTQKNMLLVSGVKGTDLSIDPLIFLTSTFFILGTGLLFLRVFPLLIRFIFSIGRKRWTPVLYASFIQVGRSGGREQFLMLFIIFTISLGIFSMNSARTINRNIEDRVSYETGTDITLEARWQDDNSAYLSGDDEVLAAMTSSSRTVHYAEPYFKPYTELSGISTATKVLRKNDIFASMPNANMKTNSTRDVKLMGIIPHEFGRVAWFRKDLLKVHINNYLNLMTDYPSAMLLSKSLQKKFNIKEGGPVDITWSGQGQLSGVVFAFIDYWPGINPYTRRDDGKSQVQDFIVANLSYINEEMTMEPYEVWMKKAPGATSAQVYEDMKAKELTDNTKLSDLSTALSQRKNDPMLQGINGSLTLGFIVTMLVSISGFIIYWVLSARKRQLQFGVFRAMGLSQMKVIGILAAEQVLISGTSVVIGVLIGKLSSYAFVRLFEIVNSSDQQVLPFRIVEYAGDYIRLFTVVSMLLLAGLMTLGVMISRIKVSQVVKLGED